MLENASLRVKEIHTRFLYSFFFDGRDIGDVSAKLQAAGGGAIFSVSDERNKAKNAAHFEQTAIWQCAAPVAFYQDEVLRHVKDFLFAADSKTCEYLKVAPEVLNAIFHHHFVTVHLSRHATMPIKFIPKIGIELFLTTHGVGVLSIGLAPARENLTLDEAIDFNYRLARFEPMPPAALRIPHPSDNREKFEQIPQSERARIAPPPPRDAPLGARLGAAGGVFTLPELVNALLSPLREFDLETAQPGFSVCTVARFGAETDFGKSRSRTELAHFISALAQVEESNHAGTSAVGVSNTILNRKHWAAIGLLGAAHLVADQTSPTDEHAHPFDEQRVSRVRDKYFIPHLIAILQRLFLDQTIRRATRIADAQTEESRRQLAKLRDAILQFAVAGHFVQVSSRQSLHRFYRLAQQGLDVPEAWAEVRLAISDLDGKFAVEREHHLAQVTSENLTAINRVQKVIHLIEYVIVGTYLAELGTSFTEKFFKAEKGEEEWLIPLMMPVFFALGLVLVYFFNLYVKRETDTEQKRENVNKT